MGAWGSGVFENDVALDLLDDLEPSDPSWIREVLRDVLLEPADYLGSEAAVEGLVAAEIAAAAAGFPTSEPGAAQAAVDWALRNARAGSSSNLDLAMKALTRIDGEGSELRDLWEEHADGAARWSAVISDLKARLAAARDKARDD